LHSRASASVENLLADAARGAIDVQYQRTPFWEALLSACGRGSLARRGTARAERPLISHKRLEHFP
jgi:hypothetical protein